MTEIVYALGEEARLVARDTTSLYPPAALKLPDVGYMRRLAPEGVLSATPDLILALEGSGPPEALAVLEEAGVPFKFIPGKPHDRKGLEAKIIAVADALGKPEQGRALAKKTDQAIAAALARHPVPKKRKRVMFVLSTQGDRIMAAGRDTAAAGVIALAGGRNVFDFSGYKPVNAEAVIAADPEVLIMMQRHRGEAEAATRRGAELLNQAAVAQTTAGKAGTLLFVDGPLALGFGPRTAEAIADLAPRMYPKAASAASSK